MKRFSAGVLLTWLGWMTIGTAVASDPIPPPTEGKAPAIVLPADGIASGRTDPIVDGEHLSTFTSDLFAETLRSRDPFQAGQCNFQFMSGYLFDSGLGPGGPSFNYLSLACRLGWMVTTPCDEHGWLRGNAEILLELNYGSVLASFGSYVTGPCAIARYNFVQPDSLFIPYIQGGAGIAITDGGQTPFDYQQLIGQEFEFLLRAEIGARFMVMDCLSLDAELSFQHISNASLAESNGGVNNVGFTVGFTYFFGPIQ